MLPPSSGFRNFPVVEQILNEQEANGLWLEGHLTVEDKGPPSLVSEEEQPLQIFGQMTDKVSGACALAADFCKGRYVSQRRGPDIFN